MMQATELCLEAIVDGGRARMRRHLQDQHNMKRDESRCQSGDVAPASFSVVIRERAASDVRGVSPTVGNNTERLRAGVPRSDRDGL
jgi:hypothetical protein